MSELESLPCGVEHQQSTIIMLAINGFLSFFTVLISIAASMTIIQQKLNKHIPSKLYYAHLCFYFLSGMAGLCREPQIVIWCYEVDPFGLWWRMGLQFVCTV